MAEPPGTRPPPSGAAVVSLHPIGHQLAMGPQRFAAFSCVAIALGIGIATAPQKTWAQYAKEEA